MSPIYHLDLRRLGLNVWRGRTTRGIDLGQLAKKAHVNVRTLQRIEAGQMPTASTFLWISRAFGGALDELLRTDCTGEGESLCLLCRRRAEGRGLSGRTVRRVESGREPRLDTMLLLANALGMRLEELLRPHTPAEVAEYHASRAKHSRKGARGASGNTPRRPRVVH